MGDDNKNNMDTFGILFTAEKGKKFDVVINNVERQLKKIPAERRLRVTGDFNNRVSPQLQKAFKDWDDTLKRKLSNPFERMFNKERLEATEQFFSKLKLTAVKAMSDYERELDALQGEGRDYTSGDIFKTRTAINAKKLELEENKKILEEMTKARDEEIQKQKEWKLLPSQKDVLNEQQMVQKQIAKINKFIEDSTTFSSPIGSKNISEKYNKVLEQSDDLSKKAVAIYQRTGDKSYYEKVLNDLKTQKEEYKNQQAQIQQELDDLRTQMAGASNVHYRAMEQLKLSPSEENRLAVQETQADLDKLQEKIKDLNNDKISLEIFTKLNRDQLSQALKNWKGRESNPIAMDRNFKTEQLPNQFQARQRATTSASDSLATYMRGLTSDTYIQELNARRDKLLDIKNSLDNELKIAEFNDKKKMQGATSIEKQNNDIKAQETLVKGVEREIVQLNNVMSKLHKNVRDIRKEMIMIYRDTKGNPLQNEFESIDLSQLNKDADKLNSTFSPFVKRFRNLTIFGKIAHKVMWNIYTQIATFINPLNIFQRAWDDWINRWDNLPIKNTFEVISYNLVTVVAPLLEKMATFLLRLTAILNVFTKAWFGVNLFDKTAWQIEQIKKGVGSMTASFDELHSSTDNPNQFNTGFDTGLWDEDTLIGDKLKKSLEDFASWAKPFMEGLGKVLAWALENPLQALLAGLGIKLFGHAILSGLGSLLWKGIKSIFTGSGISKAAGTAGAAAGSAFGSFWGTTAGKVIKGGAGAALAITGNVMVHDGVKNLTKYWDTLGTGEKVLYGLESAGGLAASTLGGAMLGSVIPGIGTGIGAIAGFVVGATNAFITWGTTAPDAILSVEDASNQLLTTLQNQQIVQQTYTDSLSNLSLAMEQLEAIERQTGISGEQLNELVESGKLSVDEMTASQLQVYSAYLKVNDATKTVKDSKEELEELNKKAVTDNIELALSNAKASGSYDDLADTITEAWEKGEISTDEARTYIQRAMGDMSDSAREDFANKFAKELTEGLDYDRFKSAFEGFGDSVSSFFSDLWSGIQSGWQSFWNWLGGKGWNSDADLQGKAIASEIDKISNDDSLPEEIKRQKIKNLTQMVPSYDVGTNYVPNDQLAFVHQGEAIVPAKYNKPYNPNNTSALNNTINAMNNEIAQLRQIIQNGIPVKGEFRQRGSDLVATVEKGKNKNGNQPLSNPAYAR